MDPRVPVAVSGGLPVPIPVDLRDSGFQPLFELYALREWAWDTMCHLPDSAESHLLRSLDRAIVELESEPLEADRAFEAVTHCPAGHIGAHPIVGRSWAIDDAALAHCNSRLGPVERVCCFVECRIVWSESG